MVKFADTQKEKDQKKMMAMKQSLWNMGNMNMGSLTPQYLSVSVAFSVLRGFLSSQGQEGRNLSVHDLL